MTWLVDWNGKEYDIDPGEFTGLELSQIKLKAGFTYRELMTEALPNFDADAIRALFWVVDRRDNPDLNFGDYEGPPMRVFIASFGGYAPLLEQLGKALEAATPATNESDGSDPSPSSTDALIGTSGLG